MSTNASANLYTARRRNLRISPRKLRLAANLINGKEIQDAMDLLDFSVTKSARILNKILNSAFSNAEAKGADIDKLVVQSVTVNKGMVLKRRLPSGRGRTRANCHRFSHVDLHLAENLGKFAKVSPALATGDKDVVAPAKDTTLAKAAPATQTATKPATQAASAADVTPATPTGPDQ